MTINRITGWRIKNWAFNADIEDRGKANLQKHVALYYVAHNALKGDYGENVSLEELNKQVDRTARRFGALSTEAQCEIYRIAWGSMITIQSEIREKRGLPPLQSHP